MASVSCKAFKPLKILVFLPHLEHLIMNSFVSAFIGRTFPHSLPVSHLNLKKD